MLAAEHSPPDLNASLPDRLIKWDEAAAMVGYSKATLYAKIRAGEFPGPLRPFAAGSVRWSLLEVQAVITAAIAARERARSATPSD
jgi:predicted DNA-binding transcriptional regulator AlpA